MIPDEWRKLATFVRSPVLPDKAAGISFANLRSVGALFLLDLVLMGSLLGLAFGLSALGLKIPENSLSAMKMSPTLIGAVVVIAPVLEELGFRGWLSGRPGQSVPLAILIIAVLATGFLTHPDLSSQGPILGGALVVAIIAAFMLRGQGPFSWFQRYFAWFYVLSCLAFGAVHLTNYKDVSALFLLLVIPQGLAGVIFGYSRVRYGLWSDITLHMLHNATFLTFAILQTSAS